MGTVWSATHLGTGRRVAIKILRAAGGATAVDDARARFLLEARSACAVEHPNVIEVYDVVDGDTPFLVMELLEGETLEAALRRQRVMTSRASAELLLPVVSALGTSHARGIVHRDLKPSNIFLAAEGDGSVRVKVLDFGIAKWVAPDAGASLTVTGSMLGTPSYMAPEQATGEPDVDHRADVWALGVVLYECLAGSRPVEAANPTQMMMRLSSIGIVPIERLVADLPQGWAALIGRMLSPEPSRRPADLREVYDLLSASSPRRCPRFGEPNSEPRPTPLRPEEEEPAPTVSLGSVREGRARRWRALSLLAAAVALTGGVAFGHARSTRSRPERDAAELATVAATRRGPDAIVDTRAAAPATASEPASVATGEPDPLERARERRDGADPVQKERSMAPPAPRSRRPARASPVRVPGAPRPAEPARVERATGLPSGSACERSEECRSRYCVALSCR